MIRYAFVTITDWDFFPGTLATVNSVLEFHPLATVYVVQNDKNPLSGPQAACLGNNPRIRLLQSSDFSHSGRYIAAWELKAYAIADLAERGEHDVLVGIDSDSLLCSDLDAEIRTCFQSGDFLGGKDGDGRDFDASYGVYGIDAPTRTDRYMSTSLYLCAVNEDNKATPAKVGGMLYGRGIQWPGSVPWPRRPGRSQRRPVRRRRVGSHSAPRTTRCGASTGATGSLPLIFGTAGS